MLLSAILRKLRFLPRYANAVVDTHRGHELSLKVDNRKARRVSRSKHAQVRNLQLVKCALHTSSSEMIGLQVDHGFDAKNKMHSTDRRAMRRLPRQLALRILCISFIFFRIR